MYDTKKLMNGAFRKKSYSNLLKDFKNNFVADILEEHKNVNAHHLLLFKIDNYSKYSELLNIILSNSDIRMTTSFDEDFFTESGFMYSEDGKYMNSHEIADLYPCNLIMRAKDEDLCNYFRS